MKQTSTYPLRLPPPLKAAVAEKVSAMKTAGFFAARSDEAHVEPALRILRRDGGAPPDPDDALPQGPVTA